MADFNPFYYNELWGIMTTAPIRYAVSDRFKRPQYVPFSRAKYANSIANATFHTPVAPQNQSSFLDQMLGPMDASQFDIQESCQYLQFFAPPHHETCHSLPIVI